MKTNFMEFLKKEKVDELKIQIDNILDGRDTSEDEKLGNEKILKKYL